MIVSRDTHINIVLKSALFEIIYNSISFVR